MKFNMMVSTIASIAALTLTSFSATAATRTAFLRANFADSRINLRSTPSVSSAPRGAGSSGNQVQVFRQRPGTNRNTWYYVQVSQTGAEGWVDGTYVRFAEGGDSITVTDSSARHLVREYEVRVFTRNGQTRMNVFNRRTNRTQLNGVPVTVRRSSDGVTYEGRDVVLFLNSNGGKTITLY